MLLLGVTLTTVKNRVTFGRDTSSSFKAMTGKKKEVCTISYILTSNTRDK